MKGEDLLWLDKPNAKLTPETRAEYDALGLPAGPFQSVAFFASAMVKRRTTGEARSLRLTVTSKPCVSLPS